MLSWSVSGNTSGVKGYHLYRQGSSSGPIFVSGPSASSFTDFGLTPSTNYCYYISPVDASGKDMDAVSEGRDACAQTDSSITPQLAIDMSSSKVSGSDIILSWTVSGDAPGFSRYSIERDGQTLSFSGTARTFTDSGIEAGRRYCYTVYALDVAGTELGRSAPFCASTSDVEAPSTPAGLGASVISDSGISLSWSASTDNAGVTGYRVFRYGNLVATVQGTSCTDSGLSAPNTYCYQVSAIDAAGNESVASSESCVVLDSPDDPQSDAVAPSVPSNVRAAAASSSAIDISWNASTDNTAVTGYRIYRNGSFHATAQASSLSYRDTTGLTASTNYCYALSAVDAAGNESEESSSSCATTMSGVTVTSRVNDTGFITWANAGSNTLTVSQPDFPGQDADYGRDKTSNDDTDGSAGFSYTKIGANGEVLPVVAVEWSAVLDNVTGLMWENKTDDGGIHDRDNTYSWYEPDSSINGGYAGKENGGVCPEGNCDTWHFVQAVNAERYVGYNDWRMPSIVELNSICNLGRTDPAIVTRFFANVGVNSSKSYFSSSPYAVSGGYAWTVYFNAGFVTSSNKLGSDYVRLVRGGQ